MVLVMSVAFLSARSNKAKSLRKDLRQALAAMQSPKAVIVHRKNLIPQGVYAALFQVTGREWSIGDSTEMKRVNLGCMSDIGDFRRLLHFAVVTDSICVIGYTGGGISTGYYLAVVWYKGRKRVLDRHAMTASAAELTIGTFQGPDDWYYQKREPSECLCPSYSFDEQVSRADAILVGKVVATGDDTSLIPRFNFGPATQYTIVISDVYKGVLTSADTVRVNATMLSMSCGERLMVGKSYIIYASNDWVLPSEAKNPPQLVWHKCSRTRLASDTAELALLREYREMHRPTPSR